MRNFIEFHIPESKNTGGLVKESIDISTSPGQLPRLFNTGDVYPSPYQPKTKIPSDLEKFSGPNTISNQNPKVKGVFLGVSDVDYLYHAYKVSPQSFEGPEEGAFNNRESVYRLTLRLMGNDYYKTFYTAVERSQNMHYYPLMDKYQVDMVSDILKEIGLGITPQDKPRYSTQHHVWTMIDVGKIKESQEYNNNSGFRPIPNAHVTLDYFKDKVFGVFSEHNTKLFILKAMQKGGIGYLIKLLFAMYGTKGV